MSWPSSLTPALTRGAPSDEADLMSYLFGNILMLTPRDLYLIGALAVAVLLVAALFHKQLLAVCFDDEFASLRGVRTARYHFLLLGLTALTVVVLVSVVVLTSYVFGLDFLISKAVLLVFGADTG